MRFSRDISGIPIIDEATGRILGHVGEWLLDQHGEAVVAFTAESGGWLPQKKVISYINVVSLGDDAVLVDGSLFEPDIKEITDACSVLGKRVITAAGQELGLVDDILFDEDTGKVTGLRLTSGLIDDLLSGRPVLEKQFTIGEGVLIVQ